MNGLNATHTAIAHAIGRDVARGTAPIGLAEYAAELLFDEYDPALQLFLREADPAQLNQRYELLHGEDRPARS